uniref:NADH-ubiquinone oxidoreductase chain 2 n=1 Tax=Anadara pilula TaxID=935003 RepID=A0A1U9ALR9_9BIVA|nr:NADH dehydrogenase subunit 2 [Anadara pilula]
MNMYSKFNPEKVEWWWGPLFFVLLVIVFSTFGVKSWFIMTLLMDVMTIIFLVMVSVSNGKKYGLGVVSFVIHQSISSIMLYLSYLFCLLGLEYSNFASLLTMIGLFWKMGLPPFHGWFSSTMMEISWGDAFALTTLMKVPPTVLAGGVILESGWYYVCCGMCLFSMFSSSMASAGQLSLRGFFTYSSMINSCWLILGSVSMIEFYIIFFLVYMSSTLSMMLICKKWDVKSIVSLALMSRRDGWLFACSAYVVAGPPPYAGFFPKFFICYGALCLDPMLAFIITVLGYFIASIISLSIYVDVSNEAICAVVLGGYVAPLTKVARSNKLSMWMVVGCYSINVLVGFVSMLVSYSCFY